MSLSAVWVLLRCRSGMVAIAFVATTTLNAHGAKHEATHHYAPFLGDTGQMMSVARTVLAAENTTMTHPGSSQAVGNAQVRAERLVAPRYLMTFQNILVFCRRLGLLGDYAGFNTVLRYETSDVEDAGTVDVTASESTSLAHTRADFSTAYAEVHRFTFVRGSDGWKLANDVVLSCGTEPLAFSGQKMECDTAS
jgi:hypothetical protein